MKTQIINLSQLPLNKSGKIKNINCDEGIKRRLLDMGLVSGTNIIPVLVSPSSDPRAFLVRGSIIAIRKEDAENIIVKVWNSMYFKFKGLRDDKNTFESFKLQKYFYIIFDFV